MEQIVWRILELKYMVTETYWNAYKVQKVVLNVYMVIVRSSAVEIFNDNCFKHYKIVWG